MISLASLMNYGPYAQKYTQVYYKNEWIRLSQDVSFEYNRKNPLEPWKITSPDFDLIAEPLACHCKKTKIPPLFPFVLNISHSEFVVKINGRIKINNEWISVQNLFGIMEEHFGK